MSEGSAAAESTARIDMADNIKGQLKSLGVAALCPFLSFRFLVPIRPPGGIVSPEKGQVAMPHVVPCLREWCGAAIKDANGEFCGCGAAPGTDVANLGRAVDSGLAKISAPCSPGEIQPGESFAGGHVVLETLERLKSIESNLTKLVGAFIEVVSKRGQKPTGGRKG